MRLPIARRGLPGVGFLLFQLLPGDGRASELAIAGEISIGHVERRLAFVSFGIRDFQGKRIARLIDAEDHGARMNLFIVMHQHVADEAGDIGRDPHDIRAHAPVAGPGHPFMATPGRQRDERGADNEAKGQGIAAEQGQDRRHGNHPSDGRCCTSRP